MEQLRCLSTCEISSGVVTIDDMFLSSLTTASTAIMIPKKDEVNNNVNELLSSIFELLSAFTNVY